MIILWFLLFLSWPVAEIAIFVQMGQAIGWLATIGLTLATAVAGTFLLRMQGFAAMNRFLAAAERGESPVGPVLDGMGIFVAGLFLVLPGFISDAIGLLLFIPPLRRWLITLMFRQALQGGLHRQAPRAGPFRRRPDAPGKGGFRKADNIVDAEFETLAPEVKPRKPAAFPPGDKEDDSKPDPNSPWRDR